MKVLYRFYWDCGRQGDVEGVFIAEESELMASLGKTVYFGEILGKHSDIHGTLGIDDVSTITTKADVIKVIEEYNLESGYNPLHFID